MIHLSALELPNTSWQTELRDGFKHAEDLLRYLQIPVEQYSADAQILFATKVPENFAQRMQKGNINDPLLKQVLAIGAETLTTANYSTDPVGDLSAINQKGLIHKYHGRVLIITTGACAINCRYCFRRNFPYSDNSLSRVDIEHILTTLREDQSISEVILSGGDPLLLNDKKIAQWVKDIESIAHIQRLRIHSRLPVVIPSRITSQLCEILGNTRLLCSLVLHANHSNELSADVATACQKLRDSGVTLLNQAVLLKGVNDSASALISLSEHLFKHGVLPYYLHVLDKAASTAHFDLSTHEALRLHACLKDALPGYLVPKLVREEAGKSAKTWLTER